jgi:hypothetical protein
MISRLGQWFKFWYLPSVRWRAEARRLRTGELVGVYHGRTRRRLLNVICGWDSRQVGFVVKGAGES